MLRTILSYTGFLLSYSFAELFPTQLSPGEEYTTTTKWAQEILRNLLHSLRHWIPTILNVLSLGIVVLTMTAMWGLKAGTTETLRKTIAENPRILCIDVFAGGTTSAVTHIDRGLIQDIAQLQWKDGQVERKDKQAGIPVVESVSGWSDASLRFYQKNNRLANDFSDGRSFLPDDRLIAQLTLEYPSQWPDQAKIESGIVVSRELLQQLGYADENPHALFIDYHEQKSPIKVSAIVSNIWDGEFLIPEDLLLKILSSAWVPVFHFTDFYIGPFALSQARLLAASVSELYDSKIVKARLVERTGDSKWIQFQFQNGAAWGSEYIADTFLSGMQEALSGDLQELVAHAQLITENPIEDSKAHHTVPIHMKYLSASVYLKDIQMVLPTVKAIRGLGLVCDNRIIEEIKWAQQLEAFATGISWVVIIAVAAMGAANIYLSFTQKIQQTIHEIGILKAFGTHSMTIYLIQLLETIIIWSLAFPPGFYLAIMAGGYAEKFLASTFELPMNLTLFVISKSIFWGTAVGTLLVGAIASTVATFFFAILEHPAEALRYRK